MDTNALIAYLDNMAARLKEATTDCEWVVLSPHCCKDLDPAVMLGVCEHYQHDEIKEFLGRFDCTIKIDGISFSLSTEKMVSLEASKPSMMDALRAAASAKTAA